MNESGAGSGGRMALGYKLLLYIGAWIVALLAISRDAGLLSLIYMFPLGLAAFFNRRWGNDGGWGVLGLCVAVYVVHGWFYFRSRTRRRTLFWFGVLVILFLINVPGCRSMINPR